MALPDSRSNDLRTRLYSTTQLARILGVTSAQIQTWVRQGLLLPTEGGRTRLFDFRALASARALQRLTARGLRPRRIKEDLARLARWLPDEDLSLSQLEPLADTSQLLVRTPEGDLAEASGQLLLDFDDAEDENGSRPAERGTSEHPMTDTGTRATSPRPVPTSVPDAELWFQRGMRLEEEGRPEEAVLAYARALDPTNPRAEVAFNLGNVLYSLERNEEAAQCFSLAVEVDPDDADAWNNLGNALAADERYDDAQEAFERALTLSPDYADAHFNLGETLAALGRMAEARTHWEAYLEHDPSSDWANEVRARLRRTAPAK